jgi:hypothetical protein
MNAVEYLLKLVDTWQWFFTLTWCNTEMGSVLKRETDVDEYLRQYSAREQVSLADLPTAIRWERGEKTQRPHCHVLLAGLPNHVKVTRSQGYVLGAIWMRSHGLARVRPWRAALRAEVAAYMGKGLDCLNKPIVSGFGSANGYELHKFNSADRLVFNPALWERLQLLTGTSGEVARGT